MTKKRKWANDVRSDRMFSRSTPEQKRTSRIGGEAGERKCEGFNDVFPRRICQCICPKGLVAHKLQCFSILIMHSELIRVRNGKHRHMKCTTTKLQVHMGVTGEIVCMHICGYVCVHMKRLVLLVYVCTYRSNRRSSLSNTSHL
jgi:hypothetical protein